MRFRRHSISRSKRPVSMVVACIFAMGQAVPAAFASTWLRQSATGVGGPAGALVRGDTTWVWGPGAEGMAALGRLNLRDRGAKIVEAAFAEGRAFPVVGPGSPERAVGPQQLMNRYARTHDHRYGEVVPDTEQSALLEKIKTCMNALQTIIGKLETIAGPLDVEFRPEDVVRVVLIHDETGRPMLLEQGVKGHPTHHALIAYGGTHDFGDLEGWKPDPGDQSSQAVARMKLGPKSVYLSLEQVHEMLALGEVGRTALRSKLQHEINDVVRGYHEDEPQAIQDQVNGVIDQVVAGFQPDTVRVSRLERQRQETARLVAGNLDMTVDQPFRVAFDLSEFIDTGRVPESMVNTVRARLHAAISTTALHRVSVGSSGTDLIVKGLYTRADRPALYRLVVDTVTEAVDVHLPTTSRLQPAAGPSGAWSPDSVIVVEPDDRVREVLGAGASGAGVPGQALEPTSAAPDTTPVKQVYFFGEGEADGVTELPDASTRKALLGGKGAGMQEMLAMGIPVPPGFTLTTQAGMAFLGSGGEYPAGLEQEVNEALRRLEQATGKRFGDTTNPLLVAVRSGAPVSMPGMMDTVLNLGLNDETVEALARATGDRRFAFDSYCRLIEGYGSVVLGIDKQEFAEIRKNVEQQADVKPDAELSEQVLEERLLPAYRGIIRADTGGEFPTDVNEQLWGAIRAVFHSWNSDRAKVYRADARRSGEEIPEDMGTAVSIVAMVFGNLGEDSGTGIYFTRNSSTGEREPDGEFLLNAQGEDVVSGRFSTRPIRELKGAMPGIYGQLLGVGERLEQQHHDMRDLEFTVERGKLYMLQDRRGKRTGPAAVRMAVEMAGTEEDLITRKEAVRRITPDELLQVLYPHVDPDAEVTVVVRGAASSMLGAAVGVAAFTPEEAVEMAGAGQHPILIRTETDPEDIAGMLKSVGILTARGGATSHAMIVAKSRGKPAIVGAPIEINEGEGFFRVGETVIRRGETFTLDAGGNRVLLGKVPLLEGGMTPELETLLGWADDMRTMGVRVNADTAEEARLAREYGAEGIGLVRTEHMFFDAERLKIMRQAIMAEDTTTRQPVLDQLEVFQQQDFEGLFGAMSGLPVTIRLLDPPLHEFLPKYEELLLEVAHLQWSLQTVTSESGAQREELKEKRKLLERVEALREVNPMLGHRGARVGIVFPEFTRMQARAIMQAAVAVHRRGRHPKPEIMVPLIFSQEEFDDQLAIIEEVAGRILSDAGLTREDIPYTIGTMIELPGAAGDAGRIAATAEFASFGTNDLTQTTLGLSRDDAQKAFLQQYLDGGLLSDDPFVTLHPRVQELMRTAIARGRATRPGWKMGICGEHGRDPASIRIAHRMGLDYVSPSSSGVLIARLVAAQAALEEVPPAPQAAGPPGADEARVPPAGKSWFNAPEALLTEVVTHLKGTAWTRIDLDAVPAGATVDLRSGVAAGADGAVSTGFMLDGVRAGQEPSAVRGFVERLAHDATYNENQDLRQAALWLLAQIAESQGVQQQYDVLLAQAPKTVPESFGTFVGRYAERVAMPHYRQLTTETERPVIDEAVLTALKPLVGLVPQNVMPVKGVLVRDIFAHVYLGRRSAAQGLGRPQAIQLLEGVGIDGNLAHAIITQITGGTVMATTPPSSPGPAAGSRLVDLPYLDRVAVMGIRADDEQSLRRGALATQFPEVAGAKISEAVATAAASLTEHRWVVIHSSLITESPDGAVVLQRIREQLRQVLKDGASALHVALVVEGTSTVDEAERVVEGWLHAMPRASGGTAVLTREDFDLVAPEEYPDATTADPVDALQGWLEVSAPPGTQIGSVVGPRDWAEFVALAAPSSETVVAIAFDPVRGNGQIIPAGEALVAAVESAVTGGQPPADVASRFDVLDARALSGVLAPRARTLEEHLAPQIESYRQMLEAVREDV